jgi:hypothetical protein
MVAGIVEEVACRMNRAPESPLRTGNTIPRWPRDVLPFYAGVGSGVGWFFSEVHGGARHCAERNSFGRANTGDFRCAAFWCARLQSSLPGF